MNKQLTITSIASIAALMLLAGAVQEAAAAGFLKIDGIDGEATDDGHKDWINLLSVSFGIDRPSSSTGGGGGAGKATFGDIVVVKEVDASTPKLQGSIAKGEHIRSVKIDFTKTFGDKEVPYLQWELENVIITSYSFSGSASGDTIPTDQISLNFEKIKVTYTKLDKKGQSQGNVEFEWNVEEGES